MITDKSWKRAEPGVCPPVVAGRPGGDRLRVRGSRGGGLTLLVLAVFVGCGRPDGLVSVSGIVTLDGSPYEDAWIQFYPDAGVKTNGGYGRTDRAGRFTLETPQGKRGIFPGDYLVLVTRVEPPEADQPGVSMSGQGSAPTVVPGGKKDPLPLVYSKPQTTPLKQSIGPKGAKDVLLQLESVPKSSTGGRRVR